MVGFHRISSHPDKGTGNFPFHTAIIHLGATPPVSGLVCMRYLWRREHQCRAHRARFSLVSRQERASLVPYYMQEKSRLKGGQTCGCCLNRLLSPSTSTSQCCICCPSVPWLLLLSSSAPPTELPCTFLAAPTRQVRVLSAPWWCKLIQMFLRSVSKVSFDMQTMACFLQRLPFRLLDHFLLMKSDDGHENLRLT